MERLNEVKTVGNIVFLGYLFCIILVVTITHLASGPEFLGHRRQQSMIYIYTRTHTYASMECTTNNFTQFFQGLNKFEFLKNCLERNS